MICSFQIHDETGFRFVTTGQAENRRGESGRFRPACDETVAMIGSDMALDPGTGMNEVTGNGMGV